MRSYQPAYIKSQNRKVVFDLFQERPKLSRAEITQLTGMSFPTVMKVVEFLVSKKMVEELGTTPSPEDGVGRKRRMLRFNARAYHAVGVELEGRFAHVGLVDLSGALIRTHSLALSEDLSRNDLIELADCVRQVAEKSPSPVLGLGMGFPGVVDPASGEIVSFHRRGVVSPTPFDRLFPGFKERAGMQVFLENDVNLACVGENFRNKFGAPSLSMVYLSLGTGFGAGIMLDGRLWRGESLRAGEVGNFCLGTADSDKPPALNLESRICLGTIEHTYGVRLGEGGALSPRQKAEIAALILPHLCGVIYNLAISLNISRFILSGVIPSALGDILYESLNRRLDAMSGRLAVALVSPPECLLPVVTGGASMVFERLLFDEVLSG